MEHGAGGEGRGPVCVHGDGAVEVPLVEGEAARGVARVARVADAGLIVGLELDRVDAVAEGGDEAILQPKALRGQHERVGFLDRVGIGARAGREVRVVGVGPDGERRNRLRGIAGVVG